MRVSANHPSSGGGSLRADLDGGAAAAFGPPVAASEKLQYVTEGNIETSGLQHDAAYLSLIFLDSRRNKIGSVSSEKLSGTSPWQKVSIGPVLPPAGTTSLIVGLHVEPQGAMQDLHGAASFGGLWVGHVPHLMLTAQAGSQILSEQEKAAQDSSDGKPLPTRKVNDANFLIFPLGRPIEIVCSATGFAAPQYDIHMRLLDFNNQAVAEHRQSFSQVPATGTSHSPSSPAYTQTVWRLPGDIAGFYRVRATVEPKPEKSGSGEATALIDLTFAVVEPKTVPSGSEFGWSLGPHDADLGLVPLADLLCDCGIRWVKFPFAIKETVAVPPDNGSSEKNKKSVQPGASKALENAMESLINFSDRLATFGVRLVGVLQPPQVSSDSSGRSYNLLAAEAFSRDPKSWYPSIEPVLSRLATEIRRWQIGDDRDSGWTSCRDLPGIVSRTKAQLDQVGQDLDVGIAWNLRGPLPIAASITKSDSAADPVAATSGESHPRPKPPWRFLSMPCDASMSNDALASALENTKSSGITRWIVMETLPSEGHAPQERIAHMVDRIATAKMHGAEAIFISDPLDAQHGLLNRQGQPSELFLPWRTTVLTLGGLAYAGDLDLPQGHQIHCFTGSGKYVGLLAGGEAGNDAVYLGTELRVRDLWGSSRACPPTISTVGAADSQAPAPQSVIAVQTMPTFLTDLDGPSTQWQLDVALSPDRLSSIPNVLVPVTLELRNSFPHPISGRVSIRAPENWYLDPRNVEFRLEPGAAWKQQLQLALPNDVVGGRQMMRLDFEIRADRLYRFTMYRPLTVTLGDVMFEGRAALNSHGEIEVRQTLINTGKRAASFRCNLQAPDRQRQTSEVSIQPTSKSDLTYRLTDGEQLLGKSIWLRSEEINGAHVLNFRIDIPAAAAPETPKPLPTPRPGSSLVM
jgi:hypothetical protein